MGFDDIPGAAYHSPSLTTIRQPLVQMGRVSAQTLLERIENEKSVVQEIAIEPLLIVRESTGRVPTSP